ncbi:MAG: hypothetical protein LBE12_12265 [Planctomycetaceae bacterium]|nr:hypothetical protein [Planctomycetaceae bacterium]
MRLFFIILLGMFGVSELGAASNEVWKTTVSVQWQETPLAESLKRLAETQKIGLFIDRRLDPSTPIHFESTGQPLGKILQQLAISLDYGCVLFESTVYFGTKESATILPVLLSDQQRRLEKLTPRRNTIFRRKKTLPIPFLSEPKEILQKLALQNNFHWKNLEILPHDLWDEKSLNYLSLNELLTVLLIGFEMTFEIENDGEILVIVPLSQLNLLPSSPANTENLFENTEQNIQNIHDIQNIHEQKIQEAQKVQKIPDTQNVPKIPLAQRRFTLKVENLRLDILLQSLAERLHLRLDINEKSLADKGVQPDNRISFEVKNVTVAQLFRAILRPLKLDFQIKDETLYVR